MWFKGTTIGDKTVRPFRLLAKLLPPGCCDQYILWRNLFGGVEDGTTYDEFLDGLKAREPLLFSHPRFKGREKWASTTWGKYFKPAGSLAKEMAKQWETRVGKTIPIGSLMQKKFQGRWYKGKVISFDRKAHLYQVSYMQDGDSEELTFEELKPLLLAPANQNAMFLPNPKSSAESCESDSGAVAANKTRRRKKRTRKNTAPYTPASRPQKRTWPNALGTHLIELSDVTSGKRGADICCICNETCEKLYYCNGCNRPLHVICGKKDERPGARASAAWCCDGNISVACYPPGHDINTTIVIRRNT